MIHWLLLPPLALLTYTTLTTAGGFVVQAANRGEPVRLDRKQLSFVARESVAHALFVLLRPLGLGQPEPDPAPGAPARPPVLLLAGYTTNRSSLIFLRTFLRQRGWGCVWAVNAGSHSESIARRAARLGERVERLKARAGADQVDLVAFSTGGLVAAWYLKHLEGAPNVRRLVALGTPWRGTQLAVFARHASAREILYGSHVLDGLRPPPVPTLCVWSPDDPIVVPASSAAIEGVDNVRLDAAGHFDLLLSARAYRAVQQALTHPLTDPSA